MKQPDRSEVILKWTTIVSATLVAIGFWGVAAAMLASWLFGLSSNKSLLYVGLPVGLVIGIFLWPKVPKIMGWESEFD